jgi:hypothetical protein
MNGAVLLGDGPVLVEDQAGVLGDAGVQVVGGPVLLMNRAVLVGEEPAL